ncbi:MAG: hypothetical protein AAF399_02560, partial [Bacteroidota bacterium]
NFVGEYVCFHPDLENGETIIEGQLWLHPHPKKRKELRAEYTSYDGTRYRGKCEHISECLYITVRDSKVIIHHVAHVGVRPEPEVKLIYSTCTSIDNHGMPVSFTRIFVGIDYIKECKGEVEQYLTMDQHWVPSQSKNLEEIKNCTQENALKPLLKPLAGTFFSSYNYFSYLDKRNKDLSINAWQIKKEKERLTVERKGAHHREFTGEITAIDNEYICIALHVKGDINNKRLYIGKPLFKEPDQSSNDHKEIKEIRLIGLTYNRQNEVIAGREILIPQQVHELKSEMSNSKTLKQQTPDLYQRVFSYLENGENASYPFSTSPYPLSDALVGRYFVYYLNSRTSYLRCNLAEIKRDGDQYTFTCQSKETVYTVISVFRNREIINVQLKDERQDMYFAFHLTYEKGIQSKDKINILSGTFSSVGFSSNKPVAGRILFVRDTGDHLETTFSKMGIYQNPLPDSDEKAIEEYLKLNKPGPINAEALGSLATLKERVKERKSRYLIEFQEKVLPSINPGLRENYPGFVEGLLEIVNSFTREGTVALGLRYVPVFRIFYDDFLRHLAEKKSDGVFYATSFARKNYFWHKDNTTEQETRRYVAIGAKMKRLFFIESLDGRPDEEERKIIERHVEIYGRDPEKGAVYVCFARRIPRHLYQVFCTDTFTQVSWRLSTTPGKDVDKFQIETEEEVHRELKEHFLELVERKEEGGTVQVTEELLATWRKASQ